MVFASLNMVAASPKDDPRLIAERIVERRSDFDGELRVIEVRNGRLASYVRFEQVIDGLPVIDGGAVAAVRDGDVQFSDQLVRTTRVAPSGFATRTAGKRSVSGTITSERAVIFNDGGVGIRATEVIAGSVMKPWAYYFAHDGSLLDERPLYYSLGRNTTEASFFRANPVTVLGNPSLTDEDDSTFAVPDAAYETIIVSTRMDDHLGNELVEVLDVIGPANAPAIPTAPLHFRRDDPRFEEVMAYVHVNRSVDYMRELGFDAFGLFRARIVIDAHASTEDLSTYTAVPAGAGKLYFGDGGVDDAEDPDVINHEFMHNIHDAIAPGALGGRSSSEARALAEGFADYWAMSRGYDDSVEHRRDPNCIGDWDVRCGAAPSAGCRYPAGADCLRRTDSRKTMADYIRNDVSGVEHLNGEIWSSFLQLIFDEAKAAGSSLPALDALILETLFGIAPAPTFSGVVIRMMDVDRQMNGGANVTSICRAARIKGIISAAACLPAGAPAIFPAVDRDVMIPDAPGAALVLPLRISDGRIVERVIVNVDIEHQRRADLRIELIAPDGTVVVLQEPSVSDAGTRLKAAYGLDTMPVQSLELLSNRSASGIWRLRVTDTASRDTGFVRSWSLALTFTTPRVPDTSLQRVNLPMLDRLTTLEFVNRSDPYGEILIESGESRRSLFVEAGKATVIAGLAELFRERISAASTMWAHPARLDVRGEIATPYAGGFIGSGIMPALAGDTTRLNDRELHFFAAPPGTVAVHHVVRNDSLIEIRYFDADGVERPNGSKEIVRGTLRVRSGIAEIAALYETQAGDMFIPAIRPGTLRRFIPVAGGLRSLERDWKTDLHVANISQERKTIEVTFHSNDGSSVRRDISLAAGATQIMSDVTASLFGLVSAFGWIEVGADEETICGAIVRTSHPVMPTREWVEALPLAAAHRAGELAEFAVTRRESSYTNIGFAEVTGRPVDLLFEMFAADGSLLERRAVFIPPFASGQLSSRSITAFSSATIVRLSVVGGGGAVMIYRANVDEKSSDSFYTPARRTTQ